MANTARDLIKCRISNAPGTSGGFTLAAAAANSLMPAASDDGLAFKLNITENGVGTEIRRNCTYTHSTTTFTRGTMVRSTGAADAALDFGSSAIVRVVPSAEDYLTTEQVAAAPIVLATGAGNAEANTAAINARLAAGGSVSILGSGVFTLSATTPIVMRSSTSLILGNGVHLRAADDRTCPVITNEYCASLVWGTALVRSGNVVTVSDAGHFKAVGQQIWVGAQSATGTDSSFLGVATVLAVTPGVSWTYASTGSDGNAGATTVFYSMIPVRQSLAGTAFVATNNYVTVTEAGHNKRPGMVIWIGKVGGDAFAPGLVYVTKVSASTWTYKTAAATGTATGTFILNYDFDINIDGIGATVDGNRENESEIGNGNAAYLSCTNWGAVSGLRVNTHITGTSLRAVNIVGCSNVLIDKSFYGTDCLVALQVEGGVQRMLIDSGMPSSSQISTSTAQQPDDYVAFTGTKAVGGAGNYDSLSSPYGLSWFEGIEVRSLLACNSLNAIKFTSHADCPFLGSIKIGALVVSNLDNTSSIPREEGIRIYDDGPGLAGTTIDTIHVEGPIEWSNTGIASIGLMTVGGAGSVKAIYINGANSGTNTNSFVHIISGSTVVVGLLQISNSRSPKLSGSNVAVHFEGGTVRRFRWANSRIGLGATCPQIYLNGGVVSYIEFDGISLDSDSENNGYVIQYAVASSVKSIVFRDVSTEQGSQPFGALLRIMNVNVGTLDVVLDNIDVSSASVITAPSTSTGTVDVVCVGKVKWTTITSGNFLQCGGSITYNVFGSEFTVIPDGKIALFGYETPTYRISMPSAYARVNMNSGDYVGSQMAPVNGDIMYNLNDGTLGIGKIIRRAGAWAAL